MISSGSFFFTGDSPQSGTENKFRLPEIRPEQQEKAVRLPVTAQEADCFVYTNFSTAITRLPFFVLPVMPA